MFGVVGQVGQIATPILKHNLDQDLRQLLSKMVECAQDQVQNQDLVQVRRYSTVIYFQNFGMVRVFEVILLIFDFQAYRWSF